MAPKLYKPCLLCLIFLLASCAGQVKIDTNGCHPKSSWFSKKMLNPGHVGKNFVFSHTKWINLFRSESQDIFLKTILEKRGINCSDLNYLNIETSQGPLQALTSFLPFFTMRKFKIIGNASN